MTDWIKCSDRLPDGKPYSPRVLTCVVPKCGGYTAIRLGWVFGTEWMNDGNGTVDNAGFIVTHWMPLPEPPKDAP